MGPSSKDSEISQAKAEMETCVIKCADSHINMLPNMCKKIKEAITKGSYT